MKIETNECKVCEARDRLNKALAEEVDRLNAVVDRQREEIDRERNLEVGHSGVIERITAGTNGQ